MSRQLLSDYTDGACSDIEFIAVVAHEVNRGYCAAIGDASQKPWNEAEPWQRDSAIKGVQYALAHPDATPADQHEAWLKDKLADGWVHGPVKDPEKKQHPCIVPYTELPLEQRVKDYLFQSVVKALS